MSVSVQFDVLLSRTSSQRLPNLRGWTKFVLLHGKGSGTLPHAYSTSTSGRHHVDMARSIFRNKCEENKSGKIFYINPRTVINLTCRDIIARMMEMTIKNSCFFPRCVCSSRWNH